jgi:hypothetical protein
MPPARPKSGVAATNRKIAGGDNKEFYLNGQLGLPPSLTIHTLDRDATFSEQRKNILVYLGFSKYDNQIQFRLLFSERRPHRRWMPSKNLGLG